MTKCSIMLRQNTKRALNRFRIHLDESYDDVISRLIDVKKNSGESKLNRNATDQIKCARKRINAGNFITESEAKKRLEL